MSLWPSRDHKKISRQTIGNKELYTTPRKACELTVQLKIRNIFQMNAGRDSWNGHCIPDAGIGGAWRLPPPFTLDRHGRTNADSHGILASIVVLYY